MKRVSFLGAVALTLLCVTLSMGMHYERPPTTTATPAEAATPTIFKTLPHLYGAPVTDATFADKVVIVTFFASWCPPCREEFTYLRGIHDQYHASGVEIIAVNLFEDFDNFSDDTRLTAFLNATQPPFTVVKGNQVVSQHFGTITRIPSVFVFDRQGQQVMALAQARDGDVTTLDEAALRQIITSLL